MTPTFPNTRKLDAEIREFFVANVAPVSREPRRLRPKGGAREGPALMTPPLPRLALTVGDPAGIGPEIVLKALAHQEAPAAEWVVYGSKEVLKVTAARMGLSTVEASGAKIEDVGGRGSGTGRGGRGGGPAGGEVAVIRAAEDAMRGELAGLVTAPLNKEAMHIAGYNYPGHTELLAHIAHTPNVAMMFVGGKIRVALLTIHAPLKDVPETRDRLGDRPGGGPRAPRPAEVSRPAREGRSPSPASIRTRANTGTSALEEQEVFPPALADASLEGASTSKAPFPGDTLFVRASRGDFDAVIACYHDQGLIPVKLLAFGEAVNVTIGLPFIRTSVDHGTGFDIAGKGVAEEGSLLAAMRLAVKLASD